MHPKFKYTVRINGGSGVPVIDLTYDAFNKVQVDADNEAKAWAARQLPILYPVYTLAWLYRLPQAGEVNEAAAFVMGFRSEITVRETRR